MEVCLASAILTVLLTINVILKREKMIHGILRNRKRKIADFHKTINGQFAEIHELGEKKIAVSH